MSCPSPETLALWMEDRPVDATGLHVRECVACRDFVAELESDGTWLRAMEDLPDAAYAEVRHQVLGRLSRGNVRRYGWVGAAVAATVVLALLLPETQKQVVKPFVAPEAIVAHQAAVASALPITQAPVSVTKPAIARHKTPAVSRAPAWGNSNPAELLAALDALYEEPGLPATGASGETVVTIQTQDPNVTILLLEESQKTQGDEE